MVTLNKKMALALVAAGLLASPSLAQDKKGTNLSEKEAAATDSSKAVDTLLDQLSSAVRPGDHVLVMSNGGFGGIHAKLANLLQTS